MIPILDIILFLISCWLAYTNAGTFIGFLMTLAVVFHCYIIVKTIRSPVE